ncbi:hypothetical protein M413DRAFT_446948 [Hebeloma cylindrosporum]|uniref:Uncharacterized protein n=1 Tax=Hebeloma cylindrosporum TaxID=76867 RepID=A0A0C3BRW0_HEBCY|nr:hypothetical protein M413DRAFT_446948 [Hebeloma cylindrosporum h7]
MKDNDEHHQRASEGFESLDREPSERWQQIRSSGTPIEFPVSNRPADVKERAYEWPLHIQNIHAAQPRCSSGRWDHRELYVATNQTRQRTSEKIMPWSFQICL